MLPLRLCHPPCTVATQRVAAPICSFCTLPSLVSLRHSLCKSNSSSKRAGGSLSTKPWRMQFWSTWQPPLPPFQQSTARATQHCFVWLQPQHSPSVFDKLKPHHLASTPLRTLVVFRCRLPIDTPALLQSLLGDFRKINQEAPSQIPTQAHVGAQLRRSCVRAGTTQCNACKIDVVVVKAIKGACCWDCCRA